MENPDAVGESGAARCGDQVRIQLRIGDGRVRQARFLAFGCPAATAAASRACQLLEEASLHAALALSVDRLDHDLGGLGDARRHGAEVVIDAVARATEAWYSARLGHMGLPRARNRIAVAMSGGVDSAVAAMRLRDQGAEVVGVTMRLWHDPTAAAAERSCCSPETVQAARATAHRLGIAHLTIDAADVFRRGVVEAFIEGYRNGITPNPCVTCNGSVRFRLLDQAAALLGARGLATGHYGRVVHDAHGRPAIAEAADATKDQSYMLAMLPRHILERLYLPLGDLHKPAVRAQAQAACLPAADAVESQDICFVGEGGYVPFLARNASMDTQAGDIVDGDGAVVGHHTGYWKFTVGQRKGLGVASPDPLYVVATDAAANRVVVGDRAALEVPRLVLADAVCHGAIDPHESFEVRVRYRGRPFEGRAVVPTADDMLAVDLAEPAYGVAPGQTAAVYQRGRLVAAGTIAPSRIPCEVS